MSQIGSAKRFGGAVLVRGTPRQLHTWAHRQGAAWPCSELCRHGKTVWARFDVRGDLVDGNVPEFCPADEFSAWADDVLRSAGIAPRSR